MFVDLENDIPFGMVGESPDKKSNLSSSESEKGENGEIIITVKKLKL